MFPIVKLSPLLDQNFGFGQAQDQVHGTVTVTKGKAKSLTASFYDVLPPDTKGAVKEPGEWNHSRIFVLGDTVEHWLNGKMVLQYKLGSKEVLDAVQNSKFKKYEGFGSKKTGHILLTDHKDQCEFKNIHIREFK